MTIGRVPGPVGASSAAALSLWKDPVGRGSLPGPIGYDYVFADKDGSGGQTSVSKRTSTKADSVASLNKPSDAIVQKLKAAIDSVMKENHDYETSKKAKDEPLRLKKEKVLKDIVQAFGVGQKFVTSLEFDNRDSQDEADTIGTAIIAFDGCLKYPGYCASVILHESSHAQRNAELANAGVDSNKMGIKDSAKWSALKEFEGTQLEIDSAATTGISADDKRFATKLRDGHLHDIETLMGEKTRQEIEKGNLDDVRDRFIKELQSRK
jgi:hypothetical protein